MLWRNLSGNITAKTPQEIFGRRSRTPAKNWLNRKIFTPPMRAESDDEDYWQEWLDERAGILQFDAGLSVSDAEKKKTRKELWTQPAAVRLSLIGRTIYPATLQSKAPHTRRRQIMGTRVIRLRDVIRAPAMAMYLPPKSRMR